ncbi:MAG: hypothetical protein RI911_274 [Candidatus Parcubacteria bacterium]|jgi:drug/metabolite transporter (DMT)-like permease
MKEVSTAGILALIAASFFYASLGGIARTLDAEYSILEQTYIRTILSCMFLVVLCWGSIRFSAVRNVSLAEWGLLVLRSLFMYVGGVLLFVYGILHMKYGIASLIASFPFVALFGSLWYGQPLTPQKIAALCVAVCGLCVLGVQPETLSFSFGLPEYAVVLSSVSFGIAYATRLSHSDVLNDIEIAVLMFLVSSILVYVLALISGSSYIPHMPHTTFVAGTLLIGSCISALAMVCLNYGFKRVSIVYADVLLMLEIPFALFVGYAFYTETLTLFEACGTVLICGGIYWLHTQEGSSQSPVYKGGSGTEAPV